MNFAASDLFPRIPEPFGGGKPRHVRLAINTDDVAAARSVGVPVPARGNATAPMVLLFEGSDYYVVKRAPSPNEALQPPVPALRLSKDIVKGTSIEPVDVFGD